MPLSPGHGGDTGATDFARRRQCDWRRSGRYALLCPFRRRRAPEAPRQLGQPLLHLLVLRLQLRGFPEINKSRVVLLLSFFPIGQDQRFLKQQARRVAILGVPGVRVAKDLTRKLVVAQRVQGRAQRALEPKKSGRKPTAFKRVLRASP
jgi:hypothetical protein